MITTHKLRNLALSYKNREQQPTTLRNTALTYMRTWQTSMPSVDEIVLMLQDVITRTKEGDF